MEPELQQRSRYLMLVLPSMFSWRKVNMTDVQKSGTTILKKYFFNNSMQWVEFAAQRIANLRVQKSEIVPFLLSESSFSRPSRACAFVPAKIQIFATRASKSVPPSSQFVLPDLVVKVPCLFNPQKVFHQSSCIRVVEVCKSPFRIKSRGVLCIHISFHFPFSIRV